MGTVVVNTVHISVLDSDDVSASSGAPSDVFNNSVSCGENVECSAKVNPVMFTPRTVNGVFSHSVGACDSSVWGRVTELHFSPRLVLYSNLIIQYLYSGSLYFTSIAYYD